MGIISSLFGNSKINTLDSGLFEEKMKQEPDAYIIDVRTKAEYLNIRIPNSVLIDIFTRDFSERIDKLDREKSYFIYCQSGSRSLVAANKMSKMGFQKIYNLMGGIAGWNGKIERG
jgi:phage shock protein E